MTILHRFKLANSSMLCLRLNSLPWPNENLDRVNGLPSRQLAAASQALGGDKLASREARPRAAAGQKSLRPVQENHPMAVSVYNA